MMKKSLLAISALVASLAMSGPASADTFGYTINVGEGTLGTYTGPYATVNVNRTDSTHATLTFTSLTTNGTTFLMGGAQAADVNVNATSWTLSGLSGTALAGFTNGALSGGGSGNANGFGVFNQTINNFDGYTQSHDSITFTLTNTSGTWTSASAVLAPNLSSHSVAIHGFVCTAPCTTGAGALVTGYATDGSTSVPEPMSLLLLGAGLAGVGIWRRKVTKG